ncbi:hypothetical protein GW796_00085 [archaeon]|nr:hypothetical protein [archaeon]
MNTQFESNEALHTKEFISVWKKISNDVRIKPTFDSYHNKIKGYIYPEHHILYNIVRGFPANRGFTDGTEGFKNALSFFSKNYYLNKMFEPFEGHLSTEVYNEILTEVKTLLNS